jgi:ferrous iron transport protein A
LEISLRTIINNNVDRVVFLTPMPFESPPAATAALPLGRAPKGFRGRIVRVGADPAVATGLPPGELERRLLEIGFVEGAAVEIVHEGLFGRDPIAIRINETIVALRRREASAILAEPLA